MSNPPVLEQLEKARRAHLKIIYPNFSATDIDKAIRSESWLFTKIAAALPQGHGLITLVATGMTPAEFPVKSKQIYLFASGTAISTFTFSVPFRTAREHATASLPPSNFQRKSSLLSGTIIDVTDSRGNRVRFASSKQHVDYIVKQLGLKE